MLKWLVGRKVDHPLANVKDARALASELPVADSASSVKKATEWLEPLGATSGLKADRLYEIVDMVDTAVKTQQRKLFQDYLVLSRQQKVQEHALWTAGFNYARTLGEAYRLCVTRCEEGASGAPTARKHLSSMIARALRALSIELKWTMMRYAQVESGFWANTGALFQYAEQGQFTDAPATIHAGERTTVRTEYLRTLILSVSRVDVLPPTKQEIAERLISEFSREFRHAPSQEDGTPFLFYPLLDRAPMRKAAVAGTASDATAFGAGAARGRVAELVTLLGHGGAVPDALNLGKTYPPDVLSVARHLALQWSDTPPVRASERRASSGRLMVTPGFHALVSELEREQGETLDFSGPGGEAWVLENVSARGYGGVAPAAAIDRIRSGGVIGVYDEELGRCVLGVIRRIARDDRRQYHVGIEITSRGARLVHVRDSTGRGSGPAVLLSSEPDERGEVEILLPGAHYDASAALETELDGVAYLLAPSALLEVGEDYERGLYRIAQKTT